MNLQLIDGRLEATMPHHSQVSLRRTASDEWALDLDGITVWASQEAVEGFASKVFEGLVEVHGDLIDSLVNEAKARVFKREAVA